MDSKRLAQVKRRERWSVSLCLFTGAIGFLQLSQILQFPPGTDVSPFTIQTVGLWPNTFAGLTIITWAFIILAVVSLPGAISRTHAATEGALAIWFALAILGLVSMVMTSSASNLVDGVGALAIPVVAYMFLSARVCDSGSNVGTTIVLWVNVFTLAQIVIAYILTGSFGPNRYYRELEQEFFGLFYHPFAFSGILGICSIVAFRQIVRRNSMALNGLLLAFNVTLIVLSNVRTYVLATGIGLALLFTILTIRRRQFVLASVVALFPAALLLYAGWDSIFGGERVTGGFDSGRIARWHLDLQAVWEEAGSIQLFMGGGPQYIFDLNESLFGSRINSLNLLIDLLVDFGIIGTISYLFIWALIIRDSAKLGDPLLVWPLAAFAVVASMISNIIAFPAVAVLLAVALTSCRKPIPRGSYAHLGASSAAVPRGSRKQQVVGRRLHGMDERSTGRSPV